MLRIWYHDKAVGQLRIDNGQWVFQYDREWVGFPIMPAIKLNFIDPDKYEDRLTEWFFDNLLPEGVLRNFFAESIEVSSKDTWSLLRQFGGDAAGALSILPSGLTPDTYQDYDCISDKIDILLANSKCGHPLMLAKNRRGISLAGAQDKMAVRFWSGELFVPKGTSPSTHILKPDSINDQYPFCPANEYFCMQLAGKMGLDVPETFLESFGGHRAYIVERYDRVSDSAVRLGRVEDKSGFVHRLHQVDGCQILGKPKEMKYEDEGGITLRDLFTSVFCQTSTDALLDWVIFNYLIGNSDAHAKNFSFMCDEKGMYSPAKLYDLICIEVYHHDNRLSSSIGGEFKAGFVEGPHWDAFALLCGLSPKLVRERLRKHSEIIFSEAVLLLELPVFTDEERLLLNEVVNIISVRAGFVKQALAQPVRLLPGDFTDVNRDELILDESVIEALLLHA